MPFTTPSNETSVTVARGDGIGPEIMDASLAMLLAAGARLAIEEIEVGEKVYKAGFTSGLTDEAWASIRRTKLLYKAPITTPYGGGYKSLNVTIRTGLGLFANVRPVRAYAPYIRTHHPAMDLVIVRENEEDLYTGIEHRQTDEVVQCLKLLSRPGSERVIRYAFDFARLAGRRKVTCMVKDNIMKLTDGMFHQVFREIAAEYPEIATEHMIVDIGAAKIAVNPERFDVVVTPNLYGDIVSDIAAEVAGSVGLAGSANIGEHGAMFEAVHGSAPDITGKGIANPSGLFLAGVEMLQFAGQGEAAARAYNAWAATLEAGIHTGDMAGPETKQKVGTKEFTAAVIARMGEAPATLKPLQPSKGAVPLPPPVRRVPEEKVLKGVDIFVEWRDGTEALAAAMQAAAIPALPLTLITNRSAKVWPNGLAETFCTDQFRGRFEFAGSGTARDVMALIGALVDAGLAVAKTENLYAFGGKPGYSLAQGQ
jgi:isocitrate dehydrogenase